MIFYLHKLDALDLSKVKLDARISAEHRYDDFHLLFFCIDLFNDTNKALKRTCCDDDAFADGNIELDRKQLSELAIHNEAGFNQLVQQVLKALVS